MTKKSEKKAVVDAKHIASLLRKLANIIEKSSQDEIDSLLKSNKELRILEVEKRSKTMVSRGLDVYPDVAFTSAANKLNSLETRELGMEFLRNEFQTKSLVEKFARFLDLPVLRTDTITTLHEKIVEAEIGSKLRSEAVQGKKYKA